VEARGVEVRDASKCQQVVAADSNQQALRLYMFKRMHPSSMLPWLVA
jgi:hypothetical protein